MELHDDIGTRKDLVLYRIESAKEDLSAAKILLSSEEIRHASYYDDFYIATKEEASDLVGVAENFIEMVEKYCNQCLSETEE